MVNPKLSITEGALLFPKRDDYFLMSLLNNLLEPHGVNANTPLEEFDSTVRDLLILREKSKEQFEGR